MIGIYKICGATIGVTAANIACWELANTAPGL